MRSIGVLTFVLIGVGGLSSAEETSDVLKEMTDKINTAAEVMGEPHDAVSGALKEAYPGTEISNEHIHCVTTNAVPAELSAFDAPGISHDGMGTPSQIASEIAARPDTQDCFTQYSVPSLGN